MIERETNLKLLIEKIYKIKSTGNDDLKGWYISHRSGPTGIGKTFEDLLGKAEDNLPLPDFNGIELKASDEKNKFGLITLFTKSPSNPKNANTILRTNYGYIVDESGFKVLHTTIPANRKQRNSKSGYSFQIINDVEEQLIKINIYDNNDQCVSTSTSWSYAVLEKSLKTKLNLLVVINTDKKQNDQGLTMYKYNSISVIRSLSLKQLLQAIDDGKAFIDLRLGVYKTGKNKGKTHDHGTGFRMTLNDLRKYADVEDIDI